MEFMNKLSEQRPSQARRHGLSDPRSVAARGPLSQLPPALLAICGLLVLAIMVSILFVDRPVAAFFTGHRELKRLFQVMAAPSLLSLPAAGAFLAYAVLQKIGGGGPVSRLWLTTSVATLAGTAAKDELKWMFGRPWPATWLHSGAYRFHPFSNSIFYGGFPSGHTSYIAAPLCVLWVLLPRWRVVWGGVIGMVMLGLVGGDYHFVGDVLGGLLTGVLCAWGSLVLMNQDDA